MFKKMKLGAKIGFGFGVLIVIAVALGGLAVWSMNGVKSTAVKLAEAKVPTVSVANQVEREALQTMYNMRGYVYTEERGFLDLAMKNLANVKEDLKKASEHAAKTGEHTLAENASKAATKVQEYEKLAQDTIARNEAMVQDMAGMTAAAADFTKASNEYVTNQNQSTETAAKQLVDVRNGTAAASAANDHRRAGLPRRVLRPERI